MNLAALKQQARLDSGVNSEDYSDANLLVQFNIAYLQLTAILANIGEDYFEEQNDRFTLLQNSALYSLPTDCIAVKQIRVSYSTPTGPSSYRIAQAYDPVDVGIVSADEENIPTSNPIYDLTNNYFRLKPTPTSTVIDGGKIWYIAQPSALVNSADTPIINQSYHELISVYGAAKMAFKYEKWNKADRLEKKWNGKILELTQTLADRDMNRPVRFKSPFEAAQMQDRTNRRELPNWR